MKLARNGHQPRCRRCIQPHYDQRPLPGFPIPRFLPDRTIGGALLVLCINHVEVPTVVPRNPNFAPSNEFPSRKERFHALERDAFFRSLQAAHNRYCQGACPDAIRVKVDTLFGAVEGGNSALSRVRISEGEREK